MGFSVAQTYLSDILHVVSQSLLAPDIILLLAFILYALFCIGSVIAEYFTERKHFKVAMPKFLAALMAAKEEDIPQVIENSGLLNRQKEALNTVYEYRALPGDALVALVRRLVNEEETRYDRITGRNNMAAKVSPMLGLMGTLIPLGPGIQALGTADTAALSSSLLVAFDTTVAGLVTAAICLVVGKIRSNWYNNYLSALDSAMATMMEKIEEGRETSTATLPEGAESFSFLFGAEAPKDEPKDEPKQEVEEAAETVKIDQVVAPIATSTSVSTTEARVDAAASAPAVVATAGAFSSAQASEQADRSDTLDSLFKAPETVEMPKVEAVEVAEVAVEEAAADKPADALDALEVAEVVEVDMPEATGTTPASAETTAPASFNFEPAKDPVAEDKPSWAL